MTNFDRAALLGPWIIVGLFFVLGGTSLPWLGCLLLCYLIAIAVITP